MIRHRLQDRVGVHDPEVLEDLENGIAAALGFPDDFLVLQVVHQALLSDERQQRI
jgi:hypothetical protein